MNSLFPHYGLESRRNGALAPNTHVRVGKPRIRISVTGVGYQDRFLGIKIKQIAAGGVVIGFGTLDDNRGGSSKSKNARHRSRFRQ